jgi:hypothetical protein
VVYLINVAAPSIKCDSLFLCFFSPRNDCLKKPYPRFGVIEELLVLLRIILPGFFVWSREALADEMRPDRCCIHLYMICHSLCLLLFTLESPNTFLGFAHCLVRSRPAAALYCLMGCRDAVMLFCCVSTVRHSRACLYFTVLEAGPVGWRNFKLILGL